MSDEEPCGRPIHPAPSDLDPEPVCLMHSRDPEKDKPLFRQEIDAILAGKSIYNRPKDTFEFTRFVFPEANFSFAMFTQNADFSRATFTQNAAFSAAKFTQNADFSGATFTQNADFTGATFTQNAAFTMATFTQNAAFTMATFTQNSFFLDATFTQVADFSHATFTQNANFFGAKFTHNANFSGATFTHDAFFLAATFTQDANFSRATFTQDAYFGDATFTHDADFSGATFTERGYFFLTSFRQVADFRAATFEKPNRILFHRVNEEPPPGMPAPVGMKARFLNCLLDGVRFEDVHWHTPGSRLVLQDELDLESKKPPTHELVADVYRRLVNNFERARQYELAEQCVVGEMEMRRLNPQNFLFSWPSRISPFFRRWIRSGFLGWLLRRFYQGRRWFGKWLGRHLSFLYVYRALSMYGSSYARALIWLALFLLVLFPLLFAWSGIRPADPASAGRQVTPRFAPLPDPLISWSQACCARGPGCDRSIDLVYTYRSALLATLEVVTFQKERTFEPAHWEGRMAAALLLAAVSGQLTLLLLALRRRFRR